ncbi:MAG: SH3 domain-containing protein [Ruminococcus sp.]|nr:SH3 domain-containing protein [Ruminococcus sp.]
MGRNGGQRAKLFNSPSVVNIVAMIVVTIFSVCVVVLLAKGLFASNSSEVPAGLDTGTIPTTTTAVPAATEITSKTTTASATASAVSTSAADDGTAYVVTYVQLKSMPDEGSSNVVCMSPNIKVKVLERRDDGYVQLSLLNGDGTTLTGYVKNEYLSPVPVDRQTETTAASGQEGEQPSDEQGGEEQPGAEQGGGEQGAEEQPAVQQPEEQPVVQDGNGGEDIQ